MLGKAMLALGASLMIAGTTYAETIHKATGTVTRVDASKHSVTIAHEPVPSMKWPSMRMAFKVDDKGLLERLAKDRKVEFEFVQRGRDYVITSVK